MYDLRLDLEGVGSLTVPGRADRDWLQEKVRGVPLAGRWHPIVVEAVVPAGAALTDCMPLGSVDRALSATAARALRETLEGSAELLPLTGAPTGYSLLNVTRVVDALDPVASKVTYTADGQLDRIVTHVFAADRLRGAPVFKIPQRPRSTIYVTGVIADLVAEAGLTGFGLRTPVWTDET